MSSDPAGMLCPACKVPLVMSERQNVEIDYCPRCRGVWLDRGELDKIIEKSVAYELPVQPGARPADVRYRDDDDDDRHRGHYRRKSWLSDIFD